MRNFPVLIATLLSVVLISCQREPDPSIISSPGNGNGNTSQSYFPLSAGTYWKYKDSVSGVITTNTIINRTKTKNNLLYTLVTSAYGNRVDTALAAVQGPNYYMNQSGYSPNTGAPYDLTLHFLNDTASAGYNWTYTAGQGNGFTAVVTTTIMERNMTVSVQGKAYSNVIRSRLELSYDILGSITSAATYDFYTARGIGIVQIHSVIDAFGTYYETSSDLVEYHIQ